MRALLLIPLFVLAAAVPAQAQRRPAPRAAVALDCREQVRDVREDRRDRREDVRDRRHRGGVLDRVEDRADRREDRRDRREDVRDRRRGPAVCG